MKNSSQKSAVVFLIKWGFHDPPLGHQLVGNAWLGPIIALCLTLK